RYLRVDWRWAFWLVARNARRRTRTDGDVRRPMRKPFVYRRGQKLWLCWHDATGKRHQYPSGLEVGDEKKARDALRKIAARIEAGVQLNEAEEGTVTVARYEKKWSEERNAQGLISAADESTRMRLHAMPTIGAMKLEDVRPRHIRDLVKALRAEGRLAPR